MAAIVPATPSLAAPEHDSFVAAQAINGSGAVINGTNLGATKEAGELNHAGNSGGSSVWYRWTAPANGTTVLDTAGSTFDTLLSVYTGGSVNGLGEVASNDDADGMGEAKTSRVTFSAVGAVSYFIAVDGFNAGGVAESGNLVLRLNAPPLNDNLAGAQFISAGVALANPQPPMVVSGTYSIGGSKEQLEPKHAGNPGGRRCGTAGSLPTPRP